MGINPTFRSIHEGFSIDGKYAVHIPIVDGPENDFFQMEEYITGRNLTAWNDLITDGHDMKAVVSLLGADVVTQLATGLMHSDLHPGNVRITPDNELVYLDRTFMIALNEDEKSLVQGMFSGDVEAIKNYVVKISGPDKEKIGLQIVDRVAGAIKTDASKLTVDLMQRTLLALRISGIRPPLSVTLALRNLHSLERLAQKAGFKNVMEMFKI